MTVVLVHPFTKVPPFGIMSIANVLEHGGVPVRIVDYSSEDVPDEKILSDCEGACLIGISAYTMPMLRQAVRITKLLCARMPQTFLVWGGVHATLFPEKSLQEFGIDAVVANEGEMTMLELSKLVLRNNNPSFEELSMIKGLWIRKGEEFFYTGRREWLKVLPFYSWPLLADPLKYVYVNLVTRRKSILLVASRGCPYDCSFCYVNEMFGRFWRGKTPAGLVDEMAYLRDWLDVTHFDFLDDLPFGGSRKLMFEFCKLLEKTGFTWSCDYRVNMVDEELLCVMKRSGCRYIYYGVESGSENVLRRVRKCITPEQALRAVNLTHEAGIACMAGFIGGFPGETVEDLGLTVSLARKMKATKLRLTKYVPYPGGDLWEDALKAGLMIPTLTVDMAGYGDYSSGDLGLSGVSEEDFMKAKRIIESKNFFRAFRFAFRHGDFGFLPYFLLDSLPKSFRARIVSFLRFVTFPLKKFLVGGIGG